MDVEPPTNLSDVASGSEYLDAEGNTGSQYDYFGNEEHTQRDQEHSIICEIREELAINKNTYNASTQQKPERNQNISLLSDDKMHKNVSPSCDINEKEFTENGASTSSPDYMHDVIWRAQKKHIFILSEAGKPIYTLHGNEDKLATLFGIIQALVSFVQHGQDALTSIHARGIKFVFLVRNSIILVAASRTNMSVQQLQMQLTDVYNQILSTLTYSQMAKIFEKRKNFDLRRLLGGSERLIYHLLSNDSSTKRSLYTNFANTYLNFHFEMSNRDPTKKSRVSNNVFTFLTNSISVLPLPSAVRTNIVSAIQNNCSKIKNLVFALLIANNKLITLVRMKKYSIHPMDLRLIFNLVECSESLRSSENWTPICLPKFDMNGYLHAYVSYLAEDCQACLLLLSVDRDVFYTLSDAKKRITERLQRTQCLEAINEELNTHCIASKINMKAIGIPELRHFLYKPKSISQLLCAELIPPYNTLVEFERLEGIYCNLLHRILNSVCPLKLIYEAKKGEVVLAWVTTAYELYAVFEPLVSRSVVIKYVDKLIKCIEKEHDTYFIRNHPTF